MSLIRALAVNAMTFFSDLKVIRVFFIYISQLPLIYLQLCHPTSGDGEVGVWDIIY